MKQSSKRSMRHIRRFRTNKNESNMINLDRPLNKPNRKGAFLVLKAFVIFLHMRRVLGLKKEMAGLGLKTSFLKFFHQLVLEAEEREKRLVQTLPWIWKSLLKRWQKDQTKSWIYIKKFFVKNVMEQGQKTKKQKNVKHAKVLAKSTKQSKVSLVRLLRCGHVKLAWARAKCPKRSVRSVVGMA